MFQDIYWHNKIIALPTSILSTENSIKTKWVQLL